VSKKANNVMLTRPFGPFVGKFSLPHELIDTVNSYVDSLSDPEVIQSLDWSQNLVGKVHQEIKITKATLASYEEFLRSQVRDYLQQVLNQGVVSLNLSSWDVERRDAWVVRSFAGDFNPAHIHSDASVCMAGFLKVPQWEDELKEDALDHAPSRGKLCFMHGNTQEWGNNLMYVEPKVGDCYIFPASLTHFVYPFKTEGERRSFSINFAKVTEGSE
tara:strand:+ start:125 stop:772 length:648 start_codon:yes stop_codon:yes gene_type:complete